MMNKVFIFFLSCCALFVARAPAYAQACLTQYEEIVDFRMPFHGANNVWASILGSEEYRERFSAAVRVESNHIVVAGVTVLRNQSSVGPAFFGNQLLISEVDLRGRVVWESVVRVAGLEDVQAIVTYKGGFVVLASVAREGKTATGSLVYLDSRGQVVEEKKLAKKGYNLVPRDIVWDHERKGFRLVATVSKFLKSGEGAPFSVLYGLSGKGRILWERSYRPGLSNMALDIERSGDAHYLLSGQIENGQKRQSGWVMAVADDGEILWQQQYARGKGARLLSASDFPGLRMVVAGQVLPAEGTDVTHSAAWVMMLNRENGEVLWQRYYRDAQNLEARDVLVGAGDDVVSVLVNSRPDARNDLITDQFVRLLTLTPQGVLFSRDDHLSGEGAAGGDLLRGHKGQRIVAGVTQQAYDVGGGPDGASVIRDRSLQGWVLSATAPEVIGDPCKPSGAPSQGGQGGDVVAPVGTVFP